MNPVRVWIAERLLDLYFWIYGNEAYDVLQYPKADKLRTEARFGRPEAEE